VTIDELGELLIALDALPLEAGTPIVEELPRPALVVVIPELSKRLLEHVMALSKALSACLPLKDRFSRRERSVYFCPLMKRRWRPERRAYSLLRTSWSASPKCRMMCTAYDRT
jgi:hypothetical protein